MKKKSFLPLIGFLILFTHYELFSQSQQKVDTTSKAFDFIKDDFIAAALDSLANLKYFEGYETASEWELESVFGFSHGFVPVYSDSVYYERLRKLDAATPINLTYNQYVRDYIDLYAVKKRGLTERVMGLAKIYFPMFEEQLDKFNMPLELKYLAIVESALNPEARSRVGATGLWQFMYGTGKMYDLNVSSFVDDRRDPIKSTIAACAHMSDLYKMYKDWLLVLAAYNSGAGNVNKAIRRSGGKMDFWQIRPFLPLETRGYVPAFIGVTYVMNYAAEHNLRAVEPIIQHYEIDTVTVKELLTFNQIASHINVPIEDLQFLNPSFKAGVIPAVNGKPYTLRLPKKYIPSFVNNEAQLYALGAQKKIEQEQLLSMMKTVTSAEYHRVKKGENLGLIAKKYHCTVSDLKRWNKLHSTTLAVGQRLIVRPERVLEQQFAAKTDNNKQQIAKKPDTTTVKKDTLETLYADALPQETTASNKASRVENLHHTVQKGETLNKIALANNITLDELKQWNNLSGTTIHPGDVLIVGKKETSDSSKEVLAENKNAGKTKTNQFIYYTVQRGDTLWTIAKKHEGCSVEDIKKLNNIRNERSIVPGQKIKVAVAI